VFTFNFAELLFVMFDVNYVLAFKPLG